MWCKKCHCGSKSWNPSKLTHCSQCGNILELINDDPYLDAVKIRAKQKHGPKVAADEIDKTHKEDVSFVFQKKFLQHAI